MATFDTALERFLQDVIQEISATPTGETRNLLCDLQIKLMEVQDSRKAN